MTIFYVLTCVMSTVDRRYHKLHGVVESRAAGFVLTTNRINRGGETVLPREVQDGLRF
jgi:hypothetical protein